MLPRGVLWIRIRIRWASGPGSRSTFGHPKRLIHVADPDPDRLGFFYGYGSGQKDLDPYPTRSDLNNKKDLNVFFSQERN